MRVIGESGINKKVPLCSLYQEILELLKIFAKNNLCRFLALWNVVDQNLVAQLCFQPRNPPKQLRSI